MWILILLICSLPVSGALWAKKEARGIVGRAITINCHYGVWYWSHVKYWCRGSTRQCDVVATTNQQNGRISITDNKSRGVFVVTMKDLRSGDAGWYSCGIETSVLDPMYNVNLQISNAPSALWAQNKVTGVLGRSITIDCHYDKLSQSHVKYWSRQCSVLVKSDDPDGRRGRISITDNKTQGLFVVTMEDLRTGDAGWYSCGIDQHGSLSIFPVKLQISDEPVSVPELRFLSPPNASCSGGSVSVSCESVQGSLPIQYTWYEKAPSEDSKISDTNKLDLHCQSFTQQHHQYYCTASNHQGEKSSEMVTVSVIHISENDCSYLTQISSIAPSVLWAKNKVTGVLGRSITIDCHYDKLSQSHVKSWSRQCSGLVKSDDPDGRRGRMSITDNKTPGLFVVTMEDLRSGDAGWYSCGIDKPGLLSIFPVKLQISDEPVSVPELRFLSPPNASCSGGSVSVSCESVQGSLPIQYTWYEKTPPEDSKISDTNKLDLHCQSFTQQHHQYYCTASNHQGEKSSETVTVSVSKGAGGLTTNTDLISNATMWILILLICSLPVSGALWAKEEVRGIVGRSITIDCHYGVWYRSHVKYWCRGWNRQCDVVAKTNWQNGRISVTDNKSRRVFVVTMKDLRSGDAGWYSCGIEASGLDPLYNVNLQISNEPMSVPELKFLSPPNASCSGGSVSVSCESVQGSLPIQYTWYEKTPPEDSKISDTNKLDLHCQSFKQQHHQYYCTASNNQGEKSSEMVNVLVFDTTGNCSYVIQSSIVSGALWAKEEVRGIVGRSITIDCHYGVWYRSHVKYWCRGWNRQCDVVAKTNWQNGRISITDNKSRRVFVVTMKDLRSGDAGWYSCGIEASGLDPLYNVNLQISNEPMSVPELKFLSPPNASCSGGSVSVSCESVQGSLPIQYTWYEKTPSEDSKISDTNKLDLHCQSFTQQHHQYYCTASNNQGEKSSEMVNVLVFDPTGNCSYVIQSSIGPKYTCEDFTTISTTISPTTLTTSSGSTFVSKSYIIWNVIRWGLFALLVICAVTVTWYPGKSKSLSESDAPNATNVGK
ncbi:Fc receptor-like protein 5 [Mustelus asterias]